MCQTLFPPVLKWLPCRRSIRWAGARPVVPIALARVLGVDVYSSWGSRETRRHLSHSGEACIADAGDPALPERCPSWGEQAACRRAPRRPRPGEATCRHRRAASVLPPRLRGAKRRGHRASPAAGEAPVSGTTGADARCPRPTPASRWPPSRRSGRDGSPSADEGKRRPGGTRARALPAWASSPRARVEGSAGGGRREVLQAGWACAKPRPD